MPGIALASIIGAAASLGGAKIASNGAKAAAKTQTAAGNQALQIQQQQHAEQQQRLAPYQQLGVSQLPRLGELAGPSAPTFATRNQPQTQPMMKQAGYGSTMGSTSGMAQPRTAQPRLVQMRAPNGTMAAIPSDQVEHYRAKGAQVVG